MSLTRITVLAAMTFLPLAALAQAGAEACKADAKKFCSQTKPGGGRIVDCLLDHQKEISDACYGTLKTHLEHRQGAQACKDDAKKFCAGTAPGGGKVVDCLLDHQKEISDACYSTLEKRLKAKRAQ